MRAVRVTVLVAVILLIAPSAHSQIDILWQRSGEVMLIGELDETPGLDVLEMFLPGQEFRVWDWETGQDRYVVYNMPSWFSWTHYNEFYLVDLFGDNRGELLVMLEDGTPETDEGMGMMRLEGGEFVDVWYANDQPDVFELAPVLYPDPRDPQPNDQAMLCLFGVSQYYDNFRVVDLETGFTEWDFINDAGVPSNRRIDEVEVIEIVGREPPEVVLHYFDGSVSPPFPRFLMVLGIEEPGTAVTPVGSSVFLSPSTPNPSSNTTMIQFNVPEAGEVDLRVYDAAGRLVRKLVDRPMLPGRHDVFWNGEDDRGIPVSSGVYFYELRTNNEQRTRKMVRLR